MWTVLDTQAVIISTGLIVSLITLWRVIEMELLLRKTRADLLIQDARLLKLEKQLSPATKEGK